MVPTRMILKSPHAAGRKKSPGRDPRSPLNRLLLSGLALLLAFTGQILLDSWRHEGINLPLVGSIQVARSTSVLLGSLLLLAAVGIWALALRRAKVVPSPERQDPPETMRPPGPPQRLWHLPLARKILLMVGFAAAIASALLYAIRGENGFARGLWLAGMLLPMAALLPLSARTRARQGGEDSPAFTWRTIFILGVITSIGLWLRLNRLEMLPYDLHGDMASYGLLARDLISGAQKNLFQTNWASLPELAFLPAALTMKLFGNNLFGLRLSAVLGGVLCLPALYLLAWRLFDSHRIAALAAAVLAVNIPHIHFSRIPAYMDPWPWMLFGTYLLVDGLRGRKNFSLALSGMLFGMGLQMYFSGRMLVPVLAVFLLYLGVFHQRWLQDNLEGLVLAAAAALAAAGPLLVYFGMHPHELAVRSQEIWLFGHDVMVHLLNKYGVTTPLEVLWQQTWRSLLVFNYTPDSSTQFGYDRPMFSAWLAPFVVLGLGHLLVKLHRPGAFLTAAWILAAIFLGSVLTVDAPAWPRLVGLLPLAAMAAATAMEDLIHGAEQAGGRLAGSTYLLVMSGLVAVSGIMGWQQYRAWVATYAHSEALVGRYLSGLPLDVTVCSRSPRAFLSVREIAFLGWPRRMIDFPLDSLPVQLAACRPPAVWIFTRETLGILAEIQELQPGGTLEEHAAASGDTVFASYRLGPEGGIQAGGAGTQAATTQHDPALPVTAACFGLFCLIAAASYSIEKKGLFFRHRPQV